VAEIEYEQRDANVRTVAKAGLALGLLAVFGAAVSFGAYRLVRHLHEGREPAAAPLAQAQGRLPPIPRLQSAPQTDLDQLRAQHLRELMSYGWIDQQAGTARIGIEEAMRLYVERAASRSPTIAGAPASLPIPSAAAGPSGTAMVPPVAPTPSPAPSPAQRPHR
jgi:hypothetical protein